LIMYHPPLSSTAVLAMTATVLAIERHFFTACPALTEVIHESGWLLRRSEGYTKRGNSASPVAVTSPLNEGILSSFNPYLPSPNVIRITPLSHPADDGFLQHLGWAHIDPSLVMVHEPDTGHPPSRADTTTQISSVPSEAWLSGFSAASELSPSQTSIFTRTLAQIPPSSQSAYLTLVHPTTAEPLAYGQAVHSNGIVGLYNLVVRPLHRRQGHGKTLVNELIAWSNNLGAETVYLQVRGQNAGAVKLYRDLGFRERYTYHYRIKPSV
jgi:hypothetical protein